MDQLKLQQAVSLGVAKAKAVIAERKDADDRRAFHHPECWLEYVITCLQSVDAAYKRFKEWLERVPVTFHSHFLSAG